jgi:hypothetical protein
MAYQTLGECCTFSLAVHLFIGAFIFSFGDASGRHCSIRFHAAPSISALSVLLVSRFLGLMMWVAAEEGRVEPPIRCERHTGAFSSDFSANFDISRIDCHPSMMQWPTIHFWPGAPYVGLDWGKVHFWAGPPFVWVDRGHLAAAQ